MELEVRTSDESVESEAERTRTTTNPIRISGSAESSNAGTMLSNSGFPLFVPINVLPFSPSTEQ